MYTTGTMFGLTSGQPFPCTVGRNMTISSAQLLCIFETGDATSGTFGRPMRVSVSGFSYTVNTQLSVRFIIVNPDETFP
jgi:hypothetical protein